MIDRQAINWSYDVIYDTVTYRLNANIGNADSGTIYIIECHFTLSHISYCLIDCLLSHEVIESVASRSIKLNRFCGRSWVKQLTCLNFSNCFQQRQKHGGVS